MDPRTLWNLNKELSFVEGLLLEPYTRAAWNESPYWTAEDILYLEALKETSSTIHSQIRLILDRAKQYRALADVATITSAPEPTVTESAKPLTIAAERGLARHVFASHAAFAAMKTRLIAQGCIFSPDGCYRSPEQQAQCSPEDNEAFRTGNAPPHL